MACFIHRLGHLIVVLSQKVAMVFLLLLKDHLLNFTHALHLEVGLRVLEKSGFILAEHHHWVVLLVNIGLHEV